MSVLNPVRRVRHAFVDFAHRHVGGRMPEFLTASRAIWQRLRPRARRAGRLPARAVRRHAPARDHRAGDDLPPGLHHRRRADHGARRGRAEGRAGDDPDDPARDRLLDAVRHPRPGGARQLCRTGWASCMPVAWSRRVPTADLFRTPAAPLHGASGRQPAAHRRYAPPKPGLAGAPPNLADPPAGCRFHPRCPLAMAICRQRGAADARSWRPATASPASPPGKPHERPAARARRRRADLFRRRPARRGRRVRAVDDVSFSLDAERPEIFAIIGESGSGKTTLARMILSIVPPTAGSIRFRGGDIAAIRRRRDRLASCAGAADLPEPVRGVQPAEAARPLSVHDRAALRRRGRRADAGRCVDEALHQVGLSLAEVRRPLTRTNCPAASCSASRSPAR